MTGGALLVAVYGSRWEITRASLGVYVATLRDGTAVRVLAGTAGELLARLDAETPAPDRT